LQFVQFKEFLDDRLGAALHLRVGSEEQDLRFVQKNHARSQFFGKAHVAYIPNGHIVGLSKIPRVVDAFARRLQVQERLTVEIRNCIQETLKPLGVAVVIEAQHLCMVMRGIQKQHSIATTSAFTGEFQQDRTRAEFIRLISKRGD